TTILAKCGITKPTQPIIPLTDTQAAVIRVEAKTIIILVIFVFTPMLLASSSPIVSKFIFHLIESVNTIPINIGIKTNLTSAFLIDAREPINQYVIAGSVLSGSATNFIKLIIDEKIDPTIIPDNTSPKILSTLNFVLIIYAIKTAVNPMANA